MSERDELAEVIRKEDLRQTKETADGGVIRDVYRNFADAVLASEWLRKHDESKWDKGQGWPTGTTNPYRKRGFDE